MTTQWTTQEIIAATNGLSSGNWTATSVSIDTRTLEKGALSLSGILSGSKSYGAETLTVSIA